MLDQHVYKAINTHLNIANPPQLGNEFFLFNDLTIVNANSKQSLCSQTANQQIVLPIWEFFAFVKTNV